MHINHNASIRVHGGHRIQGSVHRRVRFVCVCVCVFVWRDFSALLYVCVFVFFAMSRHAAVHAAVPGGGGFVSSVRAVLAALVCVVLPDGRTHARTRARTCERLSAICAGVRCKNCIHVGGCFLCVCVCWFSVYMNSRATMWRREGEAERERQIDCSWGGECLFVCGFVCSVLTGLPRLMAVRMHVIEFSTLHCGMLVPGLLVRRHEQLPTFPYTHVRRDYCEINVDG